MMMMVTPSFLLISVSRASMDFVVSGSNALVGSSHNSISGCVASARAMATRCFCPPESWAGYAPARSSRPTMAKSSATRACTAALSYPFSSRRGKATFSATVFCISRL